LKFLFFFWDAFLNSDWSRGWIWKVFIEAGRARPSKLWIYLRS